MEKKQKIKQTASLEERLPLVLEIVPGQAEEGLVNIFEPGTYQTDLKTLVNDALGKDYSIEERQVVKDINTQLEGGMLIYKGKEIGSNPLDYAIKERSEAGEDYLFIQLRAIKPQEGGLYK